MAEIEAAGYADLRDYIEGNWPYISIRTPGGSEVVRLDESDPRVTCEVSGGNVVWTVSLSGDDADITLPVTVSGSALFKADTGGSPMHVDDAWADATLAVDEDTATITHTLEVPQV